jgi:hypothetical protein
VDATTTREEMTQSVAERRRWQLARRNDTCVARRLSDAGAWVHRVRCPAGMGVLHRRHRTQGRKE